MPPKRAHEDSRVQKAVKLLKKAPVLTVRQAMLASGFLENDAKDPAQQINVDPSSHSLQEIIKEGFFHQYPIALVDRVVAYHAIVWIVDAGFGHVISAVTC